MDSSVGSADWRSRLPSNSRQKVLNKIIDTLSKHAKFSGDMNQLKNVAKRFEEKAFTAATSHAEYMNKICVKLVTMEKRSTNDTNTSASIPVNPSESGSQGMSQGNNQSQSPPVLVTSNHPILPQNIHTSIASSALPPISGISQSSIPNIVSQTSSLQTMPEVQQISIGNTMEQAVRVPPTSISSQGQISGSQQQSQNSQHYRYQQHFHQIAKQQHEQNNSTTAMQSNIQQQKLHPSHFQSSQRSIMQPTMLQPSLSTVQQNQQPIFSQLSQPVSQQHQQPVLKQQRYQQFQPQLMGHQNNLSNVKQHSSGQHNFPAIHQQHFAPQSSMKQQHKHQLPGTQSGNFTPNNQHSAHLLQSTQGQKSQVELQQQGMPQLHMQSSHLQCQSIVKLQANTSQGDMQQRLPTSGAFQQQSVIDQQKPLMQQQRAKPEASSTSSDSTAQTGNPNGGDWQQEVYQKIKAMKDKYLLHLKDVYHITISKLHQYDSFPQQFEKLKKYIQAMEHYMSVLQIDKTKISLIHKEKLGLFERDIVCIIRYLKGTFGVTMPQPLSSSLHQSQQTQAHLTQVKPRENQINSQMQSVNLQQNNMAILHQNMDIMQTSSKILQHPQYQFLQKQLHQKQNQFYSQTKQQQNGNQMINGNELKVKQQTGVKLESFQQLTTCHQQSKLGVSFSSPQTDQKNALNTVTKPGTPAQSANSPFIASSPSTPSTSHTPIDSEKVNFGIASLSNVMNIGHQPTSAISPSQPLFIGTPGVSPSPLLAEFSSLDGNDGNGISVVSEKSSTIEDPMERLLKVVKSSSPKSLSSAISNISSVLSMIENIAGSEPGKRSMAAIGENLAAMTKFHLQSTSITHNRSTETRNANHLNVVSSASDVIDSLKDKNCWVASELESTATSTIKRPRVEKRHPLLDEIRGINQGLIDTVVDISHESGVGKGTVVKCSFRNISLTSDLKSQYGPTVVQSIQPLKLLVPANYPYCSPMLLDKSLVEVSKENEDLSTKAKCRFSRCVRRLSDPISLKEMAQTWDICAHAVLVEFAQQSGGGTFTSKYGAWEECFSAA
uniref:mediator of RNA polymerase II transcription subunit 15a-like n=1 Tax=Erigeron canadensis TaxID=72917 RepID=UPI001CB921D8|nr:mediator of RNA polymerase II transcription subunit 15a-like [Erigeron canadensis]